MTALLALASAVCFGFADFLGGAVSRRASAATVSALMQVTGLPVLALLLWLVPAPEVTVADFAFGAGAGVMGGFGLLALYAGLARGRMAVVAPLTAILAASLPVVVSVGRGERPSGMVTVGILLALASIPPLAGASGRLDGGPQRQAVLLAVASGVAFAGFFLLMAETGRDSGMWPLVGSRMASLPVLALIALRRGGGLRLGGSALALTALAGTLDMSANGLLLAALQRGPVTVAVTLGSLYPAFTVLAARVVLGEVLTPVQRLAVPAAVVAVVLISTG